MAQVGAGTAVGARERECAWVGCCCGATRREVVRFGQHGAALMALCTHHAVLAGCTPHREVALSVEPDWGAPPPPAASRRAPGTKGR